MARGSKPKKVVGKRGTVYRMTVDVGKDAATGRRKQKKLTAASKPEELEKLAAQVLADVSRGIYFEPDKMTAGEYLDHWLETYAKQNVEPTTYDSYRMIINLHLKPALGNIPLAKLAPAHLQAYYSKALQNGKRDNKNTQRGLSPTKVLYHHRVIGRH